MISRDAARSVAISFAFLLIGTTLSPAQENSVTDNQKKNRLAPVPSIQDPLLIKVNKAIQVTERRFLSTEIHSPWQILHGVLALRNDYQLKRNGKKVNALEWIAQGQKYRGEHWFQKTATGGRAHPFNKPYHFEGHANQSFAIMTMADLPTDYKFKADHGYVTIQNLIDNAKATVNKKEEITWTLWALAHYLTPDAEWENNKGENWSIERLVRIQTKANVIKAPCGGTHGMFALTYARNSYLVTGQPLRGVWMEADQKIKRYIAIARSTQNRDGSFSASYFKGRKYPETLKRKVGTTGHILEFLMIALQQKQLKERWVRMAVDRIATDFIQYKNNPLDVGIMYHAMDALVIYKDRMTPRVPAQVVEKAPENEPKKIQVSVAKPIIKTINAEKKVVEKSEPNSNAVKEQASKEQVEDKQVTDKQATDNQTQSNKDELIKVAKPVTAKEVSSK